MVGGRPALDRMSPPEVRDEAMAVMGPSGCGKSILLNLISGLGKPASGTITVGADRYRTCPGRPPRVERAGR